MKILLAPDKFKGSLSAFEVCQAINRGLNRTKSKVESVFHPMADGGDGSLSILIDHLNLEPQNIKTTDPLGREISARYFISQTAAFIEVASASGLVLLSEQERNPLKTSTLGTGKMIADALSKGVSQIFLFLGGSATNDLGMGIAVALGYQFLDDQKIALKPIGQNLSKVRSIKSPPITNVQHIQFTLLCDVNNPLTGPEGAAQVYARQKGAGEEEIAILERGAIHFNQVLKAHSGTSVLNLAGSGAAGGIGAGMASLFRAQLKSGFRVISTLTGLEEKICAADWVISGEGKLDKQSAQGKVISGIAELCRKHKKPLALFVGINELTKNEQHQLKIAKIKSIAEEAMNLEDAMNNGAVYLEELATKFFEE